MGREDKPAGRQKMDARRVDRSWRTQCQLFSEQSDLEAVTHALTTCETRTSMRLSKQESPGNTLRPKIGHLKCKDAA